MLQFAGLRKTNFLRREEGTCEHVKADCRVRAINNQTSQRLLQTQGCQNQVGGIPWLSTVRMLFKDKDAKGAI